MPKTPFISLCQIGVIFQQIVLDGNIIIPQVLYKCVLSDMSPDLALLL